MAFHKKIMAPGVGHSRKQGFLASIRTHASLAGYWLSRLTQEGDTPFDQRSNVDFLDALSTLLSRLPIYYLMMVFEYIYFYPFFDYFVSSNILYE